MKMTRASHINQTVCYKINDQNFSSERSTEENTEEKETKMREEEKREKMKMSRELTVREATLSKKCSFLAVQDSSIGDLVTHSLTQSVSE